jgi:hypothetical protein
MDEFVRATWRFAELRRRLILALVACSVLIGVLALAGSVGPLRGCVPIAPRILLSGTTPGLAVEGVSGGAKQVVWGSGSDRIEQIVGLTYWDTYGADDSPSLLGAITIHGQPGQVYRMRPGASGWDLAFSWAEDGCDRTVFLPPGTTSEEAVDYASRY